MQCGLHGSILCERHLDDAFSHGSVSDAQCLQSLVSGGTVLHAIQQVPGWRKSSESDAATMVSFVFFRCSDVTASAWWPDVLCVVVPLLLHSLGVGIFPSRQTRRSLWQGARRWWDEGARRIHVFSPVVPSRLLQVTVKGRHNDRLDPLEQSRAFGRSRQCQRFHEFPGTIELSPCQSNLRHKAFPWPTEIPNVHGRLRSRSGQACSSQR